MKGKLIKEISRYCHKIRETGKHYVCFPVNSDKVITVSKTISDRRAIRKIIGDFRKVGIKIKIN